jgi:hypothetical protein
MVFLNVYQYGGRVIKGSAIMGFSLDPKECLDDATGDLRTMGCSLFYKKCQEVDMVSKLILLGVPHSIEEEVMKGVLDKESAKLERTLLLTDSEYILTKSQQANWIKCTVANKFPAGMPWEGADEKKQKQGNNNTRLTYAIQVYQPDCERIKMLCQIAKQRKLWHIHWGNAAFTVKLPDNKSQQGKKNKIYPDVTNPRLGVAKLGAASINE